MDQGLTDFVEWSVNLSFWSSVAFPLVIAGVWPWWRDWFGKTMVLFDLCFAAATVGLVLRYDWGIKFVILSWLDALGLAASFLVITSRAILIFRQQRKQQLPPSSSR